MYTALLFRSFLHNFRYTYVGTDRRPSYVFVKVTFEEVTPSNIDVLKAINRKEFLKRENEMKEKE